MQSVGWPAHYSSPTIMLRFRMLLRVPLALPGAFLIAIAAPLGLAHAQGAPAAGYRVVKTIPVGAEGGWDYAAVDAAARRLYVSHATKLVVIDIDRDTVVGEVGDTPGIHGVAFAPSLGRGYTSNGRDSTVTIFDLKTLA